MALDAKGFERLVGEPKLTALAQETTVRFTARGLILGPLGLRPTWRASIRAERFINAVVIISAMSLETGPSSTAGIDPWERNCTVVGWELGAVALSIGKLVPQAFTSGALVTSRNRLLLVLLASLLASLLLLWQLLHLLLGFLCWRWGVDPFGLGLGLGHSDSVDSPLDDDGRSIATDSLVAVIVRVPQARGLSDGRREKHDGGDQSSGELHFAITIC